MTDENLNKDGNVGTENNVSDTGVKRREGRHKNYNRRIIHSKPGFAVNYSRL